MSRKKRNQAYVVWRGRQPGVYGSWAQCQAQVEGFSGAAYQGFPTRKEAEAAFAADRKVADKDERPRKGRKQRGRDKNPLVLHVPARSKAPHKPFLEQGEVALYTDGGALGNPGPGGYGAVLLFGDKRKELSAGFRRTTNNRMELMGWIAGLAALKKPSRIALFSDSRYVGDAYTQGWAKKWRVKGWKRANDEPAKNADLWAELLALLETHHVRFGWVPGHAGVPENERCDELAAAAAKAADLGVDTNYERGVT